MQTTWEMRTQRRVVASHSWRTCTTKSTGKMGEQLLTVINLPSGKNSRHFRYPFANYAQLMMGIMATTNNLSRNFLREMFTIFKRIHLTADGLQYCLYLDNLLERFEHFVANVRIGVPLLRAYEIKKKKEWTSSERYRRVFSDKSRHGAPAELIQGRLHDQGQRDQAPRDRSQRPSLWPLGLPPSRSAKSRVRRQLIRSPT